MIITGNQQIKIKELLTMIKEIVGGEIDILNSKQKKSHHYHITTFIYRPQITKKLTPATYYDLGQGIMEIIYNIEHKFEK